MKVAVIIKHPGRDYDYRIDIVDVPVGTSHNDIENIIIREMLGPFQVISITEKINFDRRIDLSKLTQTDERHV